ncbi:MAG TPA: hypothetical protein VLU92_04040 [Candidatus Dormibacteraeota bacterium]|nr:hypothetical protein [Candidatus Dormibacteraeota bacterium]
MAKRAITIWWIVGSVVMFVGFVAALSVSYATNQGNFLNGHTGVSVALLVLSISILFIGVTLQLVAWVGSLVNARLLADKMWFKVLLWVGIAGIVTSPLVIGGLLFWALMLVYVINGADGKLASSTTATPVKFAPTS